MLRRGKGGARDLNYDSFKSRLCNREVIMYLFFGVLTTLLNYVLYFAGTRWFGLGVVVANIWAWVLAVLFAYVTNKIYVFDSTSWASSVWLKECASFFGARLFSGFVEVVFMWLTVTVLGIYDLPMKLAASFLSLVLNYLLSKILVFKNRKGK